MQSFGTEGRPAAEYVAPSSEKYECIIFKGETYALSKPSTFTPVWLLTYTTCMQNFQLQSCAGADIKDLTVLDQQPTEGVYVKYPSAGAALHAFSKISHDFYLHHHQHTSHFWAGECYSKVLTLSAPGAQLSTVYLSLQAAC